MNWDRVRIHYETLMGQVYPQPDEEGRIKLFEEAFLWAKPYLSGKSILDIGCGEGYVQEIVEPHGYSYTGIAWGKDVQVAQFKGRNVIEMDMNSLDFEDRQFDGFLMSHSWEHSPMPLIMLMEAKRVVRNWGLVILPHPDWYKYRGQNHFSVMPDAQVENLCEHAGLKVVKRFIHQKFGSPDYVSTGLTNDELWFVLRKI